MAIDYKTFIKIFDEQQVKFVIVGGVAAIIHGSAQATFDLDIVYARDTENIRNLVTALEPYKPYLRGAPPGLPFLLDEKTVQAGLNFTLTTTLGDLDMLGEVTGGGTYEDLLPYTEEIEIFGIKCFCVDLEKLIETKRAAGRPKDLEALAELQAILEEKQK
jgi:predicted nucleotidyltransferase